MDITMNSIMKITHGSESNMNKKENYWTDSVNPLEEHRKKALKAKFEPSLLGMRMPKHKLPTPNYGMTIGDIIDGLNALIEVGAATRDDKLLLVGTEHSQREPMSLCGILSGSAKRTDTTRELKEAYLIKDAAPFPNI